MPDSDKKKPICYLSVPHSTEFDAVRKAIQEAVAIADYRAISFEDQPGTGWSVPEEVMGQLAQADCAIADVTTRNPNVYFELGIAQAMGKAVFSIVRVDSLDELPFDLHDIRSIQYVPTRPGLKRLAEELIKALRLFRHSPRKKGYSPSARISTPFFIDWDKLDQSDAENLCLELLSQMGLRSVDWLSGSKEIDLIAEYPRKDPDGFEYRELWMVSMGRNAPVEDLLELVGSRPDGFFHRLVRDDGRLEPHLMSEATSPITLLLITLQRTPIREKLAATREWLARRARGRSSIRLRLWDREYLTTLIQQFPNIGYKYFSDEARSLSKYRKGPEELYQENLVLSGRLSKTIADLEEEKNRRIRAERDSVWKDISFAAAHKIGNPIFAIETDLAPLQKRINEDRKNEAIEVVSNIGAAVEKAKNIVEQFKSMTKAQQVTPVPTLLLPILTDSCKILEKKDVDCKVECPSNLTVLGDPDRLSEIVDELATNALHWFDKPEKKISIAATIADPTKLPAAVDSNREYVLLHFRDNGCGVGYENKSRIFEAFFSTYDQGTGLGLALVRRIVEGHGGAILESGIPGHGADFEIYLPLSEELKK